VHHNARVPNVARGLNLNGAAPRGWAAHGADVLIRRVERIQLQHVLRGHAVNDRRIGLQVVAYACANGLWIGLRNEMRETVEQTTHLLDYIKNECILFFIMNFSV